MEIDMLDRQIVDALRVDGRAGFSRIAELLGVSDQTVARRFRRLRTEAGVRVVGLPNGVRLGYDKWMIRVQSTPAARQPSPRRSPVAPTRHG
ncbi:Lrp/AsnC family transcriptional regulator [Dactylosporangium cerinum]